MSLPDEKAESKDRISRAITKLYEARLLLKQEYLYEETSGEVWEVHTSLYRLIKELEKAKK